jgi:hypothetical protein
LGGLDTPAPNPASTLFMAACLGAGCVVGEAGKTSLDPALSGIERA